MKAKLLLVAGDIYSRPSLPSDTSQTIPECLQFIGKGRVGTGVSGTTDGRERERAYRKDTPMIGLSCSVQRGYFATPQYRKSAHFE